MNASDLFNPYQASDELITSQNNFAKWGAQQHFTPHDWEIINAMQRFYGNVDGKWQRAYDAIKEYQPKYNELEKSIADIKARTNDLIKEKQLFETNPIVASQLRTERYNSSEAAKARTWQQTMYGRRFQDAINDIKKAGLNPYILNNFSPAGGFTGGAAQIMSNVQHHFSNIKSTNYNRNKTTSKNYNYNKNERVWNPMDIAEAVLSGFAGIIGGAGSLIGGIGKLR